MGVIALLQDGVWSLKDIDEEETSVTSLMWNGANSDVSDPASDTIQTVKDIHVAVGESTKVSLVSNSVLKDCIE